MKKIWLSVNLVFHEILLVALLFASELREF